MVINNWTYENLFDTNFWQQVILDSVKIKPKSKNDNKFISPLQFEYWEETWTKLPENITGLYFHSDIRLFTHWLSLMKIAESNETIEYINTIPAEIDISNFILDNKYYKLVLDYAEKLWSEDDKKNGIENNITLPQFLSSISIHEVVMYVADTYIMVGGLSNEKVNEVYLRLITSNYSLIDKFFYKGNLSKELTVFIFEYNSSIENNINGLT